MEMNQLLLYIDVVAVGICLCITYILKHTLTEYPSKYIPLIMSLVGIAVEILGQHDFAMDCVLTGMLSCLSSIGLYSLFKKWLQSEISKKKENNK